MLGRRTIDRRARPAQPIYEDFRPTAAWTEDLSDHVLRIHLPGFKTEDVRLTMDNTGKMTVRGTKQLGENRFARMEQFYDSPKDTKLDKISAKFDNDFLMVTFPKTKLAEDRKAVEDQKKKKEEERVGAEKAAELTKELAEKEKSRAAEDQKKEEEAVKEKVRVSEQKKDEVAAEIATGLKREEDLAVKEKAQMVEKQEREAAAREMKKVGMKERREEKKFEEDQKPKMAERKEAAVTEETTRMPTTKILEDVEKKEEAPRETVMKERKETKAAEDAKQEEPAMKEKPAMMEEKKDRKQREMAGKIDFVKREESAKEDEWPCEQKHMHKKPKERECRKRTWFSRNGEGDGWLDWLDRSLIDSVLEKINRNRKIIVVSLVAFSTGYYISQKLRARR